MFTTRGGRGTNRSNRFIEAVTHKIWGEIFESLAATIKSPVVGMKKKRHVLIR